MRNMLRLFTKLIAFLPIVLMDAFTTNDRGIFGSPRLASAQHRRGPSVHNDVGRYRSASSWTTSTRHLGGPVYEGPIWMSEWIPASKLDLETFGRPKPDTSYPVYSAYAPSMTPEQARLYVGRYIPSFPQWDYLGAYGPSTRPAPYSYISQSQVHGRMGSYLSADPENFRELVSPCKGRDCYLGCRLSLLGGGRCTRAGCLCYAAFFDRGGSPTSHFYPEDNIWYELSEAEKKLIVDATVQNRPALLPPEAPSSPSYGGPDTPGPPHVEPTTSTESSSRPWYEATGSRPSYEEGGGRSSDDDDYEDEEEWFGDGDFWIGSGDGDSQFEEW